MTAQALRRSLDQIARVVERGGDEKTDFSAPELQRIEADFRYYAERCLKIRPKQGAIRPFILNRSQRFLHEKLEEQRRHLGKVRALILKGRQQGCSTYVEARFYRAVTRRLGVRAFILTHEQEATNNLFEIASRFHDYCPLALRPHTGAANAKELFFDELDSGYKVGTAGTRGVGRSSTVQYFHGSEVGFWPFAETHASGVMQAVPDADDTEIILESTANGIGNFFHKQWQDAEAGHSEYLAIFIPWFWSEEYQRSVSEGFVLDPDESEYAELHGLSLEQMAWRRAKIAELKDEALFRQEYPATATEAFQISGEDVFIQPSLVMKARKVSAEQSGPLIIGVDPARFGDDSTAIIRRKGRVAFEIQRRNGLDTMQVAGMVAAIIDAEKPKQVFIDVGGLGAGVVDRLRELGYSSTITAVNGGERATDANRYVNLRAEMWSKMRDWLKEQPAQIPDSDTLHADLCGPRYTYDSNQRTRLERKEDMRSRGIRSPDEADALALTFAMPVAPDEPEDRYRRYEKKNRPGSWLTY